jgi:RHS repeat-associated protein
LLADGHGSTRQLVSGTSTINVSEQYNYDAYGVGLSAPTSPLTTYLYAGQQFDSVLKQYYLRARYYDPTVGRFTQTDPVAGNNFDPQSLHKYEYTHEDPVNGIDPSGRFTLIEMVLLVAVALMFTAQVANAPGPGDQTYREASELDLGLFIGEQLVVAAGVKWAAKMAIGALSKALYATRQWATRVRIGGIWQRVPVRHATGNAIDLLKGIDPGRFDPGGRWGAAFYASEDGATAVAEASTKGRVPTHVVRYELNLTGQRVLDLTQASTAAEWGYAPSASIEACQAIAGKAADEGFTVIRCYSVQVPGTVNYAILDNFNEILSPMMVSPIY